MDRSVNYLRTPFLFKDCGAVSLKTIGVTLQSPVIHFRFFQNRLNNPRTLTGLEIH